MAEMDVTHLRKGRCVICGVVTGEAVLGKRVVFIHGGFWERASYD